jgi:hypothetical protein
MITVVAQGKLRVYQVLKKYNAGPPSKEAFRAAASNRNIHILAWFATNYKEFADRDALGKYLTLSLPIHFLMLKIPNVMARAPVE